MFRLICLLGFCCLYMSMPFHLHSAIERSPLNLSRTSDVRFLYRQNSSDQNVTIIKPPLFVQKFLIIIDPGHGGHDVGTQSISKPRYQEKSLNLVTAQFVSSYLQQLGYQVLLTRTDDTFVSLDKRTQLANERNPTLFVSIHYNSAPSAEAQGVEVFFYQAKESKERTLKSKRLAQVILKNIISNTKAKSRGVKQGNYAVIRETTMPAILIEGGFVTNEAELKNLKDPTYIKRLAWGIVRGIEEYLNLKTVSKEEKAYH